MALSDFLPYGAPELIEGASARMARSTMSASLMVAMLVVAFGVLRPRHVERTVDPEPFRPVLDWIDPTILPDRVEDHRVVEPTRGAPDPNAPARVVPDHDATKLEFAEPDAPAGPFHDDAPPGPAARLHDGPIGPPADPAPGEFVPVDEMPVAIRCGIAVYPDLARSAGIEGTVRVLMLVGTNGRVERVIVAPKGSVPMLDQAALDAARSCVFTPALASGHPVKVWVSQSYRFSLHSAR